MFNLKKIDYKKVWDGAPFYFVGMNSILVYEGLQTLCRATLFSRVACAELHSRSYGSSFMLILQREIDHYYVSRPLARR